MKGLCSGHYYLVEVKGLTRKEAQERNKEVLHRAGKLDKCRFEGCGRPPKTKALCASHYRRINDGWSEEKAKSIPIGGLKCTVESCTTKVCNPNWSFCYEHGKFVKRILRRLAAMRYMGGKCADCGLGLEKFGMLHFEFHHVGEKEKSISRLLSKRGVAALKEELEKCVLLCTGCHRARHKKEYNWYQEVMPEVQIHGDRMRTPDIDFDENPYLEALRGEQEITSLEDLVS